MTSGLQPTRAFGKDIATGTQRAAGLQPRWGFAELLSINLCACQEKNHFSYATNLRLSSVACSGPCANRSTNLPPGWLGPAPHPVHGRPAIRQRRWPVCPPAGPGTVKLQLQTTIEIHPESLFFARTRPIRRFSCLNIEESLGLCGSSIRR